MRALHEMEGVWGSACRQHELLDGLVDLADAEREIDAGMNAQGGPRSNKRSAPSEPSTGMQTPVGAPYSVSEANLRSQLDALANLLPNSYAPLPYLDGSSNHTTANSIPPINNLPFTPNLTQTLPTLPTFGNVSSQPIPMFSRPPSQVPATSQPPSFTADIFSTLFGAENLNTSAFFPPSFPSESDAALWGMPDSTIDWFGDGNLVGQTNPNAPITDWRHTSDFLMTPPDFNSTLSQSPGTAPRSL